MAYPGDPQVYDPRPAYPPSQTAYGYERNEMHEAPTTRYARERDDPPYRPETAVTAGPYRFSLREGILGILAIFAILGLVLGVLGFAAAFALDRVADPNAESALAGPGGISILLVALLPFLAAPVLALGCGAWAGHASRSATIGGLAGAVGGLVGPILTLLLTGTGFALGAGAASLDLGNVIAPGGLGIAPGWNATFPFLFTGAGLLWLLGNTLAGGLTGGVVGALLDGRWAPRADRRRVERRRVARY